MSTVFGAQYRCDLLAPKTHGIVGNKITRSRQKWVKKKNGIYGYVTSKTKKDENFISGTQETSNHGKIIEELNTVQKCGTGRLKILIS